MKAELLLRERYQLDTTAFAELRVWRVPHPVPGSAHKYKYRLAYVVDGECVFRYDNEAGKGDHRHWNHEETCYLFVSLSQLLTAFMSDITRWNHENRTV